MTWTELYGVLAERGLISQSQQPPELPVESSSSTPWFVQILQGFSAWIAGLFLLGFIGAAVAASSHGEPWAAFIVIGILACVGAAFLYAAANSTFAEQFALSMSLTGQIGITVGLGALHGAMAALWGMLMLEIALVFAIRNPLHRFVSSLAAVVAWALAISEMFVPFRSRIMAEPTLEQGTPTTAILWLVVWIPVAAGAIWLVRQEARWIAQGSDRLVRPVLQGILAGLALAPPITHPAAFWYAVGIGPSLVQSRAVTDWAALWPLLAALLDLLALGLAFALRNTALMGLAILFALAEISAFYYVLGATLLIKSCIMLVMGAALMIAARQLGRASS